ncbi:hypothetical protein OIO90_000795 [Microbotryomycetes sp. JL221]|nr:hypothetical protein OIO90_000795 [Microbotryomycetes sp. JL221]
MLGLIKSLPQYHGPYKVSTTELELPCQHQEFGTATLKQTGRPALQLDTVQALLFYPTIDNSTSTSRQPWASRPLTSTAQGYSAFTGAPKWIIHVVLVLASRLRLPCNTDGQLLANATTPPPPSSSSSSSSNTTLVDKSRTREHKTKADDNHKWPLVIFSHGLGGTRTTYSQYCGELASLGYIVCAIEHRDGTAPSSTVNRWNPNTTTPQHDRTVLYTRPQDIEFKRPNKQLTQLEYRGQQLDMRFEEIRQLVQVLKRLDEGDDSVARLNLRQTKNSVNTLQQWQNKIDWSKVYMTGHSFGGATTLQSLRTERRHTFGVEFSKGIALDPWIDPIPQLSTIERFRSPSRESLDNVNDDQTGIEDAAAAKPSMTKDDKLDIQTPLLVINSEAFTKWREHYNKVYEIVKRVQHAKAWFMTLVGSVHMSFSDFPLLSPFITRKTGSRVEPKLALNLFIQASKEFLQDQDDGDILSKPVIKGDERGTRPGEGGRDNKPMEPVGDMRMHYKFRSTTTQQQKQARL